MQMNVMKNNSLFPALWLWLFLSVGLFPLFTSCTKEVEFKDKESHPRLVLNGIVTAGDSIRFNVGKSVFFLDGVMDVSTPEGTEVQLFVNGSRQDGLVVTDDTLYDYSVGYNDTYRHMIVKRFTSGYVAQRGDKVRVTVSAPGFETIEAECEVKQDEPQAEVSYVMADSMISSYLDYDSTYYYSYKLDVRLKLTDSSPGNRDCFLIRMNPTYGKMTGKAYWSAFCDSDDPIIGGKSVISDWIGMELNSYVLFNDELFDGKSYTIRLSVSVFGQAMPGTNVSDLNLELLHLNGDLYQYYKTNGGEQELWTSLFYEPVQTHNNIKNGYGIWGSAAVQQIPFRLIIETPAP